MTFFKSSKVGNHKVRKTNTAMTWTPESDDSRDKVMQNELYDSDEKEKDEDEEE